MQRRLEIGSEKGKRRLENFKCLFQHASEKLNDHLSLRHQDPINRIHNHINSILTGLDPSAFITDLTVGI